MMIEARSLTKQYDDGVIAVDALDIQVPAGEIYCLLGANGAGKTTTVHLFLGFLEPTSGSALINGVDVHREPLKTKRSLAYLSENVRLYDNLTARQNLHFFCELSDKEMKDRDSYYAALARVGLPERAFEQRVRQFSKGMRQKVGIAIAMLKDASALLLDEPMSGLDPKAAADFVALLNSLRDEGKAILMSTHDIFRAKQLADRIGIMKDGQKVAERSREALLTEDLEKLYLNYMREVPG